MCNVVEIAVNRSVKLVEIWNVFEKSSSLKKFFIKIVFFPLKIQCTKL